MLKTNGTIRLVPGKIIPAHYIFEFDLKDSQVYPYPNVTKDFDEAIKATMFPVRWIESDPPVGQTFCLECDFQECRDFLQNSRWIDSVTWTFHQSKTVEKQYRGECSSVFLQHLFFSPDNIQELHIKFNGAPVGVSIRSFYGADAYIIPEIGPEPVTVDTFSPFKIPGPKFTAIVYKDETKHRKCQTETADIGPYCASIEEYLSKPF